MSEGREAPAELLGATGFDERLLLRCALHYAEIYTLRRAVLVHPEPRDELSMRRAEETLRNVRRVLEELMGVSIEVKTVDPRNLMVTVSELRAIIEDSLRRGVVCLCLGSGMRALNVALLVAAVTLPEGYDKGMVRVCIELEGWAERVEMPLSVMLRKPVLDAREQRVLSALKSLGGQGRLSDIHEALRRGQIEYPKSTLRKVLGRLEELGVVRRVRRGYYELTRVAEATGQAGDVGAQGP